MEYLTGIHDYFIHKGNSVSFEVYYCDKCKIGFSLPVMTEEELSNYYPSDYEPHTKKNGFRSLLQSLKYIFDLKIIKRLISKPGGSIFEIGPGNAELLSKLKSKGFTVSGIEPGNAGRECALKNWGIELKDGFAKDISFDQKYDLIIARYVLEHVNKPKDVLQNIFESGLPPGGSLLLKIPNMSSWEAKFFGRYWCGWDEPRHRVHFTPEGIKNLLAQIGYINIQISFEVAPVDLPKNLEYWAHYNETNKSILSRAIIILNRAPEPLKLVASQLIGLILKPLGAGRMTITAMHP